MILPLDKGSCWVAHEQLEANARAYCARYFAICYDFTTVIPCRFGPFVTDDVVWYVPSSPYPVAETEARSI